MRGHALAWSPAGHPSARVVAGVKPRPNMRTRLTSATPGPRRRPLPAASPNTRLNARLRARRRPQACFRGGPSVRILTVTVIGRVARCLQPGKVAGGIGPQGPQTTVRSCRATLLQHGQRVGPGCSIHGGRETFRMQQAQAAHGGWQEDHPVLPATRPHRLGSPT